jgi:outer membrane protein assembly factor BamB
MKKKNTISDIRKFTVCNSIVYNIDLKNSFCKEGKRMIDGVFSIRGTYQNFLLLFDDDNICTVVWDTITDNSIPLDYAVSILGQTKSFFIVRIRRKNNYIIAKYNFINHIILKTYPYNEAIEFYYNGWVILRNENTISSYTIEDEKQYWQKEFSEKITGDILPYKDKLLVSLWNGDLICIEQANGKEVWRCKSVLGSCTCRIIERNKLYLLSNSIYLVVDLDNGKMLENIDLGAINKFNGILSPGGYVKVENKIFFINIGFSSYLPAVGAFNIETKTYDWVYRFEGLKNSYGFSGTNCLQYHDGKLYVLTDDGVLHIFEEE